tara:strand:+ start:264 stop:626 length:363 start_codon:yes stop_codon:yes gene_type:complete
MNILLVGLGGALGAISRYFINDITSKYFLTSSHISTLIVNVLGCFLLGYILGLYTDLRSDMQLFFIVGFLGSFTTMSAFSIQTLDMINNDSFGEVSLYILMTIGFTILATYIGLSIGTAK